MKTYCKGLVFTRNDVVEALHRWQKSDSGKENSWRVVDEYGTESAFIDYIWLELSTETLAFAPIRTYQKHDPNNGKLRKISVESIKRQVCNYLCVGALEPLLAAKVGFWQVSSGAKGKGAALGMRKLKREVHRYVYHVHVDIRNCYGSMRTAMVEGLVARYVRNHSVLYLLHTLLSTMGDVLILGSYLSLRLAAFVISFAYHAVENAAKERRGKRMRLVGCQVWYADDGYFLGNSKRSLRKVAAMVERVLERLGLSLKPWKVRRNGTEPIDFAGYRIWCAKGRRVDLRKRLWKRLRRAFARYGRRHTERLARRVCSYWGWLKTAVMEHQMNVKRPIFNAARAAS